MNPFLSLWGLSRPGAPPFRLALPPAARLSSVPNTARPMPGKWENFLRCLSVSRSTG